MWKLHTANTSPHDIPSCFCPFVPSLHPYNFYSFLVYVHLVYSVPLTPKQRVVDSLIILTTHLTAFLLLVHFLGRQMRQSCSLITFHLPVGKVRTVCTVHKHSTQHIHAHYDTHNYMHAYRHVHTHTHTHTSMHLSCCLCRFLFLYWSLQ